MRTRAGRKGCDLASRLSYDRYPGRLTRNPGVRARPGDHYASRVPRALITGITGQDGFYLAELLLAEGYDVVGMVRTPVSIDGVSTVHGDLGDPASLRAAVLETEPDELYHLAAPTFVPASWKDPAGTLALVAGATATLLTAAREAPRPPRVLVASSGEVFGAAAESPQNEETPMRPRSPYGVAKVAAYGLVDTLRSKHGLHASSAIAYNHESPRRPERFLPRKVSRGAAAIKLGLQDELVLGDLAAVRDWSHARDIVRGYHLMLQQDEPGDYVLAGGAGPHGGRARRGGVRRCGAGSRRPRRRRLKARAPVRAHAAGRRHLQGARAPGLGAGDELRGDDRGDGAGRPGGAERSLNPPRGASFASAPPLVDMSITEEAGPDPALDRLVQALVLWGATASQIVAHMEHTKRSGASRSQASTVEAFATLVGEIARPVVAGARHAARAGRTRDRADRGGGPRGGAARRSPRCPPTHAPPPPAALSVTRRGTAASLDAAMLGTEDPALHRLSVEDVYRMVDAGILREDEHVELIDGVLVDVSPPGPEHSTIVSWLNRHFVIGCPEWDVRVQDVLLVEGGFVLPDLMVVERLERDRHPATAALVVEVSITTLRHDTAKAWRYARAGVGEYWLVDVARRSVTVHQAPGAEGYRRVEVHGDGAVVPAPAGAPPVVLGELLGPR